jgi:serine/threonine protein kinase
VIAAILEREPAPLTVAPPLEQGKPTDGRSDLFAFGCVLYEMLTGRRAFEGEDTSTTLASVVMKEPDWGALPAPTPVAKANAAAEWPEGNEVDDGIRT